MTSATVRLAAGQEHGEIFHAAARGEKLGLPGKLETDLVHARLVNRAGDDGGDARPRRASSRGFFQRGRGGARALRSFGWPNEKLADDPDDFVIGFARKLSGVERRADNLRTDPGGVASVMPMRDSRLRTLRARDERHATKLRSRTCGCMPSARRPASQCSCSSCASSCSNFFSISSRTSAKRLGHAAAFFFDSQNVIVAAEFDDSADLSDRQIERHFLQFGAPAFCARPSPNRRRDRACCLPNTSARCARNPRRSASLLRISSAIAFCDAACRRSLARDHDHAQFESASLLVNSSRCCR